MNYFSKPLIRIFSTPHANEKFVLTSTQRFLSAQTIIRIFYALVAFFCLQSLSSWSNYFKQINPDPLWPVYWLRYVNIHSGITFICWFYFIAGLLALTSARWRSARVLIFLALLEFMAFNNSFGKINHGSHLELFLSFILIFLPSCWHSENPRKDIRAATLIVFSGCQSIIMLTYSMSGFFKLIQIPIQAVRNQVHALMPEALPLQIASRLLLTDVTSYIGPWLIEHYFIAWPLMIGTIYLQFFSLWASFRPSLHQLWGFGLILFHIATQLTLAIPFWGNCLWLSIFFLNSPFRPKIVTWQQVIRDLPLVDLFFLKNRKIFTKTTHQ